MDKNKESDRPAEKTMLSRRHFIGSLAAGGVGVAVLSSAVNVAKADSFYDFNVTDLSSKQLIDMYRQMLEIRWYDRTVADKQSGERGFRGYGHFACGQEAVSVGVCMALKKTDWIQGNHRSHAHALAKGADLKKMAAEITFKATGTNKGYGGSMHIMQKGVGMMGEDGVVGPGGVMGAGAAFGLKSKGKKQVAVTFGGDGHMTSPYFYTALMNAAKFKLPFIYVIENNGYEISQSIQKCHPHITDYTSVAKGIGVPGFVVDGQSVLNVYAVMKKAVARARAGEGATFIEAKTFRYYDHFGAAGVKPGRLGAYGLSYRSDREMRHWMAKDPLDIHKNTLINWGVFTAAQAGKIEAKAKRDVEAAFKFADRSPTPKPEDGLKHVFVEGPKVLPRQLANCPLFETDPIA